MKFLIFLTAIFTFASPLYAQSANDGFNPDAKSLVQKVALRRTQHITSCAFLFMVAFLGVSTADAQTYNAYSGGYSTGYRLRHSVWLVRPRDGDAEHVQHRADADAESDGSPGDDQ